MNTPTLPLATIGSVTFLLAAALYQITRERKHKREMYTPSADGAAGMLLNINRGKFIMGKFKSFLLS